MKYSLLRGVLELNCKSIQQFGNEFQKKKGLTDTYPLAPFPTSTMYPLHFRCHWNFQRYFSNKSLWCSSRYWSSTCWFTKDDYVDFVEVCFSALIIKFLRAPWVWAPDILQDFLISGWHSLDIDNQFWFDKYEHKISFGVLKSFCIFNVSLFWFGKWRRCFENEQASFV